MLKILIQKLNNLGKDQTPFDPSQFNDPLALRIEWIPVKRGGTSFQTRKLVKTSPYRMEFRATKFSLFFYTLFSFGGIGIIIVYLLSRFNQHRFFIDIDFLIPIFIAVAFSIAGSFLLYFGTRPVVFDKMKSAFWIGRKTPEKLLDHKSSKNTVRVNDIYAFQLISEYVRGKNSYYSYELNIVRKDGSRVNVVDHGNKTKLKQDAQTLSLFLNKPLWDSIPQ